jgi:hypothetical protein
MADAYLSQIHSLKIFATDRQMDRDPGLIIAVFFKVLEVCLRDRNIVSKGSIVLEDFTGREILFLGWIFMLPSSFVVDH